MDKTIICEDNISRLCLQLHVTGRCNQRCIHCYHSEYDNEILKFDDIVNIIKQFRNLIERYNELKDIKKRGILTVTGGEPFYRKDFMDILKVLSDNNDILDFGIMTNGSLITDEIAKNLKKLGASVVQVSIDGNEKTHNYIRGEGNFRRVFNAVDILKKNNIKTCVSFTASKMNFREFREVAMECNLHCVDQLWSDRLVPMGNGKDIVNMCLDSKEMLEYFSIMNDVKKEFELLKKHTYINIDRSLQFLVTKQQPHRCLAGDSFITIDEHGDIMPCRRMPIICGNILKEDLCEVYLKNDIMNELRKRNIPDECKKCRFKKSCNGGAKCISYALYGDFNKAEQDCPLIYYKKNKNISEGM